MHDHAAMLLLQISHVVVVANCVYLIKIFIIIIPVRLLAVRCRQFAVVGGSSTA